MMVSFIHVVKIVLLHHMYLFTKAFLSRMTILASQKTDSLSN